MLAAAAPEEAAAAAAGLAVGWAPAEAAFPHLSVTLVRQASALSFRALTSTLLQRCCAGWQQPLGVALQVG